MSETNARAGARGRRISPGRILVGLVVLLLLAYGSAMVWLVTQETRLVFRAGRSLGEARPPFPFEQIDLPRDDGARQFAWLMPYTSSDAPGTEGARSSAPWLLFLHGNAASIATRGNIARYAELRALGLNILAPEYRGFGGLDGVPAEAALAADARVAFDYLALSRQVPPSRIVIYGWSLGSAVAVHLASQVTPAAVILEGAPASIVAIGQQQYPWFPIRLLMRNPFESIARIRNVHAPLLFLHSPEDAVVPFGEGRRLYEAAHPPKRLVEVRGGHIHANDVDGAAFFGAIDTFLAEHGVLRH
jgi:fermentation-respiration switch protein FrsA (DUF1100 family)